MPFGFIKKLISRKSSSSPPSQNKRDRPFFSEGEPKINVDTPEAKMLGWVASAIDTPEIYEQRAKEAAKKLSVKQLQNLQAYFHYPNLPRKLPEAQDKYGGLGEWMSICQHAAFAIYYHRPKATLDIIRKHAFGVYDWPQRRAIHILCLLINDGIIDRATTLNEIAEFLPNSRHEIWDSSIQSLSMVTPTVPKVIQFIQEYIEEELHIFPDLYSILALTRIAPDVAKTYRPILEKTMNKDFPYQTGEYETYDHIQAARILYILYPDEPLFLEKLTEWRHKHIDPEVRKGIKEILEQEGLSE